jgi:uncharacterized protein
MKPINLRIAEELGVREQQVAAAISLLDGGATVPFVARYRKEATGVLDDAQLRTIEERLRYLRELDERRAAILDSIGQQGKLDAALKQAINAADSKARLEDLYLPYRPKRRTKAQMAREAGLEPLAEALLARPDQYPEQVARRYVEPNKGVSDATAALEGARALLIERFTEDATLIGTLREEVWLRGRLLSRVRAGKAESGAKFADYFEFSEPLAKLPSHRILALFRGEKEEVLALELAPDPTAVDRGEPGIFERQIANRFKIADHGRPGDRWLIDTVRLAWRTRILVHIESDLRLRLRQAAEDAAVQVFAGNLRDLLLAAPAGGRTTMGLDPGYRTGVKVAVVTETGHVAATTTIYPHEPQRRWDESIAQLARLVQEHRVELIAIGNGTASRETDRLGAELIRLHPELKMSKVVVSEAGASVYSASAFASQELPGLDVSLRGAVSIARRLQDPLAELVKIDPQSIGVGQYQHDVGEHKLSRSLDAVVEDCVNAVGVDVNTASTPLLSRVSGIGDGLARSIVSYREARGPFRTRSALKKVPRLGPKAFELSAGFLRISNGDDPLDTSGVHPEAYSVVRRILAATKSQLGALIGNTAILRQLEPEAFTDAVFGVPTVTDILSELEKPGRDPRPVFKRVSFREGVEKLEDVKPGMVLEGVVTNVAAFGAFVDVGVHQDGLVHISAMAYTYVSDPRKVATPGDVVRVKVLEVDPKRRRISLTMRLDDAPGDRATATRPAIAPSGSEKRLRPAERPAGSNRVPANSGGMAEAFRRAELRGKAPGRR